MQARDHTDDAVSSQFHLKDAKDAKTNAAVIAILTHRTITFNPKVSEDAIASRLKVGDTELECAPTPLGRHDLRNELGVPPGSAPHNSPPGYQAISVTVQL